jgi:formylglycine-generating enzyme required for sulfatase activity
MKSIAMMMLAACALPALATVTNTPPKITNVKAVQRANTKLVDITYDAADAEGDKLKIRVEVSDDGGKTYSVPASSFSGDFGEGVTPGTGKKIVWDAGTDWDGEYSDKMKVKVFALDGHGFPGMEFGDEVPPGGFLMGQDGGEEGNGESRHVCIPWSYWLGKYEVTNAQYCDFLNAASAMGYVAQSGASNVFATASLPVSYPKSSDAALCSIGDDHGIRWNVNKFETISGRENWPAVVSWYGAMTFCRFYGYDLPTEAEWEMAARGPDHDDENEHWLYPWKSDESPGDHCYTGGLDPFCDVGKAEGSAANDYNLFDIMGNAGEWTRTLASAKVEAYPTTESLTNSCNKLYPSASRVVRGTNDGNVTPYPIYQRTTVDQTVAGTYGFRVVRRYPSQPDSMKKLFIDENFDSWPLGSKIPEDWDPSDFGTYGVESNSADGAPASDKVVKISYGEFYLPDSVDDENVVEVAFDGSGGTYKKAGSMVFYSGLDPKRENYHDNSGSVTIPFPQLTNPKDQHVWTAKSFAPAFTDKGFQHCFSVVSNSVPIYINNLKVYVEEVVTP